MTYLFIIDFGHGLNTSGKRTPLFDDGSFMRENEFNRDVGMKIYHLLEKYENIDVVFTTTEKRDIALSERVARVNELYDKVKNLYDNVVLVSIHANALTGKWGTQNGTETYHYPNNLVDKAFAETIHKHLIKKTGLFNRGVLGGNFQIIREVKMTACLCECAFMDNLTEAKLLLTDSFRQSCAEGIANGLLEYFGMSGKQEEKKEKDEVKPLIEYKKYAIATEMKGNPLDINSAIVNKRIWDIVEFTNCVNGPFYYPDGKGKMYATSIFYDNGKVYQSVANHYYNFGCPQSVFIIYKDGTVDMKRINFLTELDLGKVQFAVGGVGLRNTQDKTFKYSPVTEGFKAGYRLQDGKYADYTDVLRKANKTVIGYNKKQNKVYLLTAKSIAHGALIDYISQGDESYDIAVSLDGGGSSFMDALGNYVFEGEKNRVIHSIIGFNL